MNLNTLINKSITFNEEDWKTTCYDLRYPDRKIPDILYIRGMNRKKNLEDDILEIRMGKISLGLFFRMLYARFYLTYLKSNPVYQDLIMSEEELNKYDINIYRWTKSIRDNLDDETNYSKEMLSLDVSNINTFTYTNSNGVYEIELLLFFKVILFLFDHKIEYDYLDMYYIDFFEKLIHPKEFIEALCRKYKLTQEQKSEFEEYLYKYKNVDTVKSICVSKEFTVADKPTVDITFAPYEMNRCFNYFIKKNYYTLKVDEPGIPYGNIIYSTCVGSPVTINLTKQELEYLEYYGDSIAIEVLDMIDGKELEEKIAYINYLSMRSVSENGVNEETFKTEVCKILRKMINKKMYLNGRFTDDTATFEDMIRYMKEALEDYKTHHSIFVQDLCRFYTDECTITRHVLCDNR